MREFTIYISSTIDDLKAERAAAAEIAARHGRLIDSYRVTEERHEDKCVADVRSAALYIGIVGHRYGWVPAGRAAGAPVSITEREFDACEAPGQSRIPRLMFVRTRVDEEFDDRSVPPVADAEERAARLAALERFRARALSTGSKFKDLAEFKLLLQQGIIEQRDAFFREQVGGRPILEQARHWPSRLARLALLSIAGADQSRRELLLAGGGLVDVPLRITDDDLAQQADRSVREAQSAMLMISPDSVGMLDSPQRRGALARVLVQMRRRTGLALLLCLDGVERQLPATWPPHELLRLDTAALRADPAFACAEILRQLSVHREPAAHTLLALPAIVLAPREGELLELLEDPSAAFAAIAAPGLRAVRSAQFEALRRQLVDDDPGWPAGHYGREREDWRCFGPGTPEVRGLLEQAVLALNRALPGSRESDSLRGAKLALRPYRFDEYLEDQDGSRTMVEQVCQSGALVLVDEWVLLHPGLRQAARKLLAHERCAVATLCAHDPPQQDLGTLTDEASHLNIGPIVPRFEALRDPQCELHLTSLTRLERWLRVAIPRLLMDLAGLKAQPGLVGRADDLLRE